MNVPIRVWDLPTRLFHWALAAAVFAAVVSAKIGGNAMAWHFRFGYAVCALLAFRILWGFLGGRWSRFSSFAFAPATVWRYARGRSQDNEQLEIGHSPLGSLAVFAMLTVLGLQVGTGLVADDEIATFGPLNRFVEAATAQRATGWHKTFGQWSVLGLVALHLAAVGFYAVVRRKNLVRPMITGDKLLAPGTRGSVDGVASRLIALALVGACAGAVASVVALGG